MIKPDAVEALKLLTLLPSDLYTIPITGGDPVWHKCPSPRVLQNFLEHCASTGLNVYFQAAAIKPGVHKKPKKSDVLQVRCLFVDNDPNPGANQQSERIRLGQMFCEDDLPAGVPAPTAYWYTGGGFQAIWLLSTPIDGNDAAAVADYEARNKDLQKRFYNAKGGGTFNADRLMRLPHSLNVLDTGKIAEGRKPAMAELEDINPDLKYSLTDFPLGTITLPDGTTAPIRVSSSPDRRGNIASADSITDPIVPITKDLCFHYADLKLPLKTQWLIGHGHPGADIDAYESLYGKIRDGQDPNDRSSWVFSVIIQMLRSGCPVGEILWCLTDPSCGISAHCRDDKDPEYCARRQVARGKATVALDESRNPEADFTAEPVTTTQVGGIADSSSATPLKEESSDDSESGPDEDDDPDSPGEPTPPPVKPKPPAPPVSPPPRPPVAKIGSNDGDDGIPPLKLALTCDPKTGIPLKSSANLRIAFKLLKVEFSYDKFCCNTLIDWEGKKEILQDHHFTRLWFEIERRFSLILPMEKHRLLIDDEAMQNSFHPVVDYFKSLKWDRVPRLNTWLSVYGGAEETAYTRAVGALPLIAAVRRIMQPGCAFQEILTLVSATQGTYKSSAIQTLCPDKTWFTDDLPLNSESKEVIERLRGHLIVECAETKGMKAGSSEHIKAFLSRQVDKARMAYGHVTTQAPRQCVFIATSNDESFLRDPTGNRRWWPVTITKFDTARLAMDRDQLWAEAVEREAAGESIGLDPALYETASTQQELRTIEHPYYDMIARCLNGLWGKILAADVWEIVGQSPKTQDTNSTLKLTMEKLHWKKDRQRKGGGDPQNCYVKDFVGDDGRIRSGKGGEWITIRRQPDGQIVAMYTDQAAVSANLAGEYERDHAF